MAHITNNCSSKWFGRSDFLVLRFFPLCCVVAEKGCNSDEFPPGALDPQSQLVVWPRLPCRPLPYTFVFPQKGCTELMCAVPVSGANHLLIAIIHRGFAVPHGALPYFTKRLPFIQKCPVQPLDKQVVSSFSRGLDFTLETNQAVNWHKALPLPKM